MNWIRGLWSHSPNSLSFVAICPYITSSNVYLPVSCPSITLGIVLVPAERTNTTTRPVMTIKLTKQNYNKTWPRDWELMLCWSYRIFPALWLLHAAENVSPCPRNEMWMKNLASLFWNEEQRGHTHRTGQWSEQGTMGFVAICIPSPIEQRKIVLTGTATAEL